MNSRMEALAAMVNRYRDVFRAAWSERRAMDPPRRTADELAFLPAHLELIDAPLSPVPRWSMRIIMALFAVALAWACFGKLDVVAVGAGKTVTSGRTRVLQPAETAVVRRILVQDGQHVYQGELLIELDATGASADVEKAREALLAARLNAIRSNAIAAAMDHGTLPTLTSDGSFPPERFEAMRTLAASQWSAFQARKQGMEAMVQQKTAELNTVESAIVPLEQYLAISRARVADYEALLEKNYVPRQEYMLRKQERINAERDLAGQRSKAQELRSAIAGAREELALSVTDLRRQTLDELRQAREQIAQYEPEVAKASQRNAQMELRSPATGTVQQLAVHTVGGVVTPAQPLLSVVPEDESLEVEVTILNKDIGFIRSGQDAVVKVDSFPYTRYGHIEGRVENVSHDAIQDEKLGLVYQGRVALAKNSLLVDGTKVKLTPGMSLSVEIKTDQRRVIDYLLSPLQQETQEAMRER
ncbi:HlyD family type I secretion periplasmic adaptor subunit [Luteibacter yeojuensis]|uniref:Membrane fusion protein (MFP) family protein n=1 Tax=Luteibacter yeojuensis TaxID=345309 RepID=A0A7X5QRK5_9GAMM|nr:HlyD family type I secretion periplasmic adaptor subunit [Luteibacter yeojuensis]